MADGTNLMDDGDSLNPFLKGKLAGHSQAFMDAGAKYNVDPKLLAAISSFESGWGTSNYAVKYNNPTGMMDPNSKNQSKPIKFDSIPDAIDATAKNLRENYLDQGLVTIPDIAAKYSPPGAANDPKDTNWQWPSSVAKIYQSFGGNQTVFGDGAMSGSLTAPDVGSWMTSSPNLMSPPTYDLGKLPQDQTA